MSTRQPANIPAALSTARQQLDRWRSRQPTERTRLPEDLWRKAVALAHKHGVNKTARALGLKYESLKKHLQATAADESKAGQGRCEFLELRPSPVRTSSVRWTIELDDGGGTTMRMHVKGACMADLASFVRGFRSPRG
ncbi:MAG: hypothetical protein AB1649_23635 [Chloroflexota bacterium]